MESGKTRAAQNKAIRQEALREQLAAQGHVQHVIDIAEKLSNLSNILDSTEIQRLKAAADIKARLISKYLPDLKAIEYSGDQENPINILNRIELAPLHDDSADKDSK